MWLWFEKFVTNQSSIMKYLRKPPIERLINRPLQFSDVCGAFYLLAFGWIIGFVAFLFEMLSFYKAKQRIHHLQVQELPDLKFKKLHHFKLNIIQKKQLQRFDVSLGK